MVKDEGCGGSNIAGVNSGLEANSLCAFCPVTSSLTWVPPISMANTFINQPFVSLSAALLEAITASNSFQDFTNDVAPSS